MARDGDEFVELVREVVGGLWRTRLEIALLATPALVYVGLRGLVGPIAAGLSVLVLAGTVIGVPGARRPLLDALHAARVRRRWRRACVNVDVPPPRVARVTRQLVGDRVDVQVPPGQSIASITNRGEELAAALQLRELRISRDPTDAGRGRVMLVRRDPLAELAGTPWPELDAKRLSLWDRIPVGVDEDGGTVAMSLPERNVLIGGEPGAGKSAALSLVIATAALDPNARLWLLDGKLVELAAWGPCAQGVAGSDIGEAIELLREVRREMEARYRQLLANGRRKVARDDGLELHLVAIDELAFYLSVEDRKQRSDSPTCCATSSRAAARPASPRRRSPVPMSCRPRCATCSGSGSRCAATRRRRRTRSWDRGGRRSATERRTSPRPIAASATCSPRTARRCGCGRSTSPTTTSPHSLSARPRCACRRAGRRRVKPRRSRRDRDDGRRSGDP